MGGEEPRAPGWYPDPWRPDGERYFDGTSWSRDHVDALPEPSPLRSRSRWGRRIGGLVAVVGAVAAVGLVALGGGGGSSHAAAPSTTASSVIASTTTSTRPSF